MGGNKLRSYPDVGGVWTACMGVTEGIGPNMTFTEAQCAALNRQKLVEHEQRLLACARAPKRYHPGNGRLARGREAVFKQARHVCLFCRDGDHR